jgi:hypothetical protein
MSRNLVCVLQCVRIGSILHVAMLVAFTDCVGFQQNSQGPASERPICGRDGCLVPLHALCAASHWDAPNHSFAQAIPKHGGVVPQQENIVQA